MCVCVCARGFLLLTAISGQDTESKEDADKSAAAVETEPILTRNDQLSAKADKKQKRKDTAKVNKEKKKNQTCKKGKGKKGKGKKGKGKGEAKKVKSRRTKESRGKAKDRKGVKEGFAEEGEWGDECEVETAKAPTRVKQSRNRSVMRLKSASSTDLNPHQSKSKKTKTKTPTSKRVKKAEKTKTKAAKVSSRRKRESTESDNLSPQVDLALVKEMTDFAMQFEHFESPTSDEFKAAMRGSLEAFTKTRSNLYWTRCAAGVTQKETGKDLCNFGFNSSSAEPVFRMAVSAKCAEL